MAAADTQPVLTRSWLAVRLGTQPAKVDAMRRGEVGYQVSVNWLTSSVSVSAAGETAR